MKLIYFYASEKSTFTLLLYAWYFYHNHQNLSYCIHNAQKQVQWSISSEKDQHVETAIPWKMLVKPWMLSSTQRITLSHTKGLLFQNVKVARISDALKYAALLSAQNRPGATTSFTSIMSYTSKLIVLLATEVASIKFFLVSGHFS